MTKRVIQVLFLLIGLVIAGCAGTPNTTERTISRLALPEHLTFFTDTYASPSRGLVNVRGEVILEANYSEIHHSFDGVARLIPVNDWGDDRWGFVDRDGTWVFHPIYREVTNFIDGIACGVKNDGTIDILQIDGNVISTVIGDECYESNEGLIPIRRDKNWGVIDTNGNTIIPFEYQLIDRIRNGYVIAIKNGHYGIVDLEGHTVVPHRYSQAHILSSNRFYLIDGLPITVTQSPKGRTVLDYDDSESTEERIWKVVDTGMRTIFDKETFSGIFANDESYYQIDLMHLYGSSSPNRPVLVIGTMETRVAVDFDGNAVLPELFTNIVFTENGGYFVDNDDPLRLHSFDTNFSITETVDIADPHRDEQDYHSDQYYLYLADAIVVVPNGVSHTSDGQRISGPDAISIPDGNILHRFEHPIRQIGMQNEVFSFTKFGSAAPFIEKQINTPLIVSLSRSIAVDPSVDLFFQRNLTNRDEVYDQYEEPKWESVLVDRENNVELILSDDVLDVGPLVNRIAVVRTREGFGAIKSDGSLILEPEFEYLGQFVGGLAPARVCNEWGYIDLEGEWIIQPRFEAALPFLQSYAPVWNGELWGYIDRSGELVIDYQFGFAEPFLDGYAIVVLDLKGVTESEFPNEDGEWVLEPPSFNVEGKWTIVNRTGPSINQPFGDRIWRLDSRRVLVLDEDQYRIHYVLEGRGRTITDSEAEDMISRLERLAHY